MPRYTYAKNHQGEVLGFDGLFVAHFPSITVTKNVAITAIAASMSLGCNVKIVQASVFVDSANADVTYSSFNICAGVGAEGAQVAANALAINGTPVFTTDASQAPVITTAGAVTNFQVAEAFVDQIFPATLNLTVRLVSPNTGTASGSLHVALLCKAIDLNSTKPLYGSTGTLAI